MKANPNAADLEIQKNICSGTLGEITCIHLTLWHRVYAMKRTNIVLDEKLVSAGLKLTGLKTQKDLVQHALQQLVRREQQLNILSLKGKVNWEGDLERMRKGRIA